MSTGNTPLLRLQDLNSGYGRVKILHGVDLSVHVGSCVAVVGSNGAGKSTLLRSISGMVDIHSGSVTFDGQDITKRKPVEVVHRGIRHVAEGRRLFRQLSVGENLELGMYSVKLSKLERSARRERAFELFPVLRRKKGVLAGTMSGGEQQMLSIAQALMSEPRLIMLDEPSLGLAPVIIDEVFDALDALHKAGGTVLLVEQMVERALGIADYAYVMQVGRIVAEGKGKDLIGSDAVRQAYVGANVMDRARPDEFIPPMVEKVTRTSSEMSRS